MKLLYVANARIPTEKAHGIQIMKMCEAFSDAGTSVTLVTSWRFNHIKEDPFEFYGIKRGFKIVYLPNLELTQLGWIGYWARTVTYSISLFFYLLFKKFDAIYGRNELPLYIATLFNRCTYWEAHDGRWNLIIKRLLPRLRGISVISTPLKDFYIEKGFDAEKLRIFPDGVDINLFMKDLSKEKAREILEIKSDKKIILYTGHLYKWKGVDTLAEAARKMPNGDFYIVGGTPKDIDGFSKKYKNIENLKIVGHVKYEKIPIYLKSADVLVLPNSGREDISKKYTSPLKLFEYMASGRPIVVSDLESMRAILDEDLAYFFKPDNSGSLRDTTETVFKNYEESKEKAQRSIEKVKNFSWSNRARDILDWISECKKFI